MQCKVQPPGAIQNELAVHRKPASHRQAAAAAAAKQPGSQTGKRAKHANYLSQPKIITTIIIHNQQYLDLQSKYPPQAIFIIIQVELTVNCQTLI